MDVFILGAAKAGTTSLFNYVAQHPHVCPSEPKEPLFFEAEYGRGIEFYLSKYYAPQNTCQLLLEGRPANLILHYVAPRICEHNPMAKFIVILRDPVERAYSHWWQRRQQQVEQYPFIEAVKYNLREFERLWPLEGPEGEKLWRKSLYEGSGISRLRTYIQHSQYSANIERFRRLFGDEQVLVLALEELKGNRDQTLERIWEHLGLHTPVRRFDIEKYNSSLGPLGVGVVRSARESGLRKLVPHAVRRFVKDLLGRVSTRPRLPVEMREKLPSMFTQEIERCKEFYNVELSPR